MNILTRKHWPLYAAMCVYWITVIVLVALSSSINQGHLIYPLDDTYIHMAIAKNTVLHHVWGVTRYEFTSSTSSPLWTFLLALTYFAFGVNDVSPLILNLFFGTLTIIAVYLILLKNINHSSRVLVFIILLVAVFVTPLPTLTVIGMEHVLHTLLTLCFVFLSVRSLSTMTQGSLKSYALLAVLAALVVASRYEGLFVVFVVCVLFLLKKRVFYAVTVGGIALLPIVVYGVWSVAQGWYFFPNSILLKGQIPSPSLAGIIEAGYAALSKIQDQPHILFLLIASLLFLAVYFQKNRAIDDSRRKYANLIFAGTLLLHLQFAQIGWLYRYEAYLVLLGIVVICIAGSDLLPPIPTWKISKQAIPRYLVVALLAVIAAFPFYNRALFSLQDTPRASNNIYEQQYQMGRFLEQFYQGKAIAVNDVGAVTYLADIHLLDIWGLGSLEPAKLKTQKNYTIQDVENLSKKMGVTIAIVYDALLLKIGGQPSQWVRVGQWKIPNNVIAGGNTVSLYAVAPSARSELVQNLIQFKAELPVDVQQFGEYTKK